MLFWSRLLPGFSLAQGFDGVAWGTAIRGRSDDERAIPEGSGGFRSREKGAADDGESISEVVSLLEIGGCRGQWWWRRPRLQVVAVPLLRVAMAPAL